MRGLTRPFVIALIGTLPLWCPGVTSAQSSELQLRDAVRNRDEATIRSLLDAQVDINAPQPDGATALHWAVYLNDVKTTTQLLQAGAIPDVVNELGVTPLYLACENGNGVIVQMLLAAGATPHAVLPSGETLLMTAARSGNVQAAQALVTHGANLQARENTEEQTALMWAVSQGHGAVVDLLVDAGADVHARSRTRPVVTARSAATRRPGAVVVVEEGGYTPLLFAARQGQLRSAQILLAAGAPANDTAPDGTSALVVAAHSGHGTLARLLLQHGADANSAGAGYTPLLAAILRGDLDLVRALLAYGANPNTSLQQGTRHARQGKLWTLDLRWVGATPLLLAAKLGLADIMRELAASGADLGTHLDGVTPLMAAAGMLTRGFGRAGTDRWGREMDSAEMELALRQDPDQRPVMNSGIDAIQVAVELGAEINAVNRDGDTALHLAAFHGFQSVVEFLVSQGASLDIENARGETPLERALRPRAPARLSLSLTDYSDTRMADLLRELNTIP
jgi:ankyrin repeat protein